MVGLPSYSLSATRNFDKAEKCKACPRILEEQTAGHGGGGEGDLQGGRLAAMAIRGRYLWDDLPTKTRQRGMCGNIHIGGG